ncbi:M48 family metallopeptidase [Mameliella sediminis]|uniref:M48 family metallopeptidase n=1 Tax=Mameliella sediminis TaxID=2836866 RepID=UPI001C4745C2|nr:M48 family metallopeptidase [Mameliella sediminis]MBY6113741.1 M48 family metallopeptidase [Antarctobacter heliothermus]MBY6142911.1 M48 family metallopeptidase [Mameliella alba]MBV7395038.1 M48 family metallopeptidase [Mameliella sediminis]MBY6159766.1 M48 family metallopeptidase [Mameliella alba]MBY6168237.1 M48 family metallopeptidase [Mameliella alba]
MLRLLPYIALALLAACAAPLPTPAPDALGGSGAQLRANRAARQFVEVVQTVEPVAERECRKRTTGMNCDFQIVVDDRPDLAPNAFQTVDRFGRPILAFNVGMINSVRNADELAFVMGHEAAHHILDHLAKTRQSATIGAVVFAGIAAISGAEAEAVRNAEQLGAAVGARTYSKEFELEADQLGTIITFRAGYDPVNGAAFFGRIPDPGNKFLGSHPPNAARLQIVAETAKALKAE